MSTWRLFCPTDGAGYFVEFFDRDGRRRVSATGTADRQLAEAAAASIVEAAARARHPAEDSEATVEDALADLLAVAHLDKSPNTVRCYTHKAGHVVRLLGALPLRSMSQPDLERYLTARLSEGAARETIRQELVTLRLSLRLAIRRGARLAVDLADLFPTFTVHYRPRDRYLSPEQAAALLAQPEPARQLWVMVAAWAGLRLSEVERLRWEDIEFERGQLRVRGTKTAGSWRIVGLAPLLAEVLLQQRKARGPVVQTWHNVRRDLEAACQRAGVPKVTPNDLRRTFASWLVQAGESNFVVSRLLGHTTTKMVDLVYGQLNVKTLRDAVGKLPDKLPE